MRVETNSALVRRNKKITQYLFYVSFGVLIVGLFIGFQPNPDPEDPRFTLALLVQALVLPVAVVLSLTSVRMTNKWLRKPRPEHAIRDALKGVHRKSVLYNYYHSPARHVLIAPQGVFAMETRFQDGHYVVNGDRWLRSGGFPIFRFLRGDNIGKPDEDARKAAAHITELLKPIAPEIEVKPLVVFVDPRARFELHDPSVPVLHADDKIEPNLKDYMRDLSQQQKPRIEEQTGKKKGKSKTEPASVIPADQIEEIARAFEEATLPQGK
jgi:hypothetical protein